MADSGIGPAFCVNEASTWKSYSYLLLQRTQSLHHWPQADKQNYTKFILTPQTWPTPSVSPLDFHIKEEKECESKCLQPRIKYTNNKGNRKKERQPWRGYFHSPHLPQMAGFQVLPFQRKHLIERTRNCALFPCFKCGKWSFFTFTSSAVPQETSHSFQISFCIIKPISIRCLGFFSGRNPESLPTSCK